MRYNPKQSLQFRDLAGGQNDETHGFIDPGAQMASKLKY